MPDLLFRNATLVNEGGQQQADVVVDKGKILRISPAKSEPDARHTVDASKLLLLPGVIDDQVHFREPGLTHKADIWHESRAAAAGGVTSFMEMPNTKPQTVTQEALQAKFQIGKEKSLVNYSFYMGATNSNLEEILKTDPKNVCGLKVFMGSSTGNMLVDDPESLKQIFSLAKVPIAVHCEDEATIKFNTQKARSEYGEEVPFEQHPKIRSEEACYKSSSLAVKLAKENDARLHILHLSTAKELELFEAGGDLRTKKITAEVCVHHLWFNEGDYAEHGARIKWNPAIKTAADQAELLKGVVDGRIDVIATDHAPHLLTEKSGTYFKAPSGGPLLQFSLLAMLELYKHGKITLEKVVERMCHAPADIFQVEKRGYLREGYWADLVLVDPNHSHHVHPSKILSKCGWSPFEETTFSCSVHSTYVNGAPVYKEGKIIEQEAAMPLTFER